MARAYKIEKDSLGYGLAAGTWTVTLLEEDTANLEAGCRVVQWWTATTKAKACAMAGIAPTHEVEWKYKAVIAAWQRAAAKKRKQKEKA